MDGLINSLKRRIKLILQIVWLGLTGVASFLFFHVLNRTKIHGRENIPQGKNILFLANHRTMIDSFLMGSIISFPCNILRPDFVPYSPAASENFFKNWLLKIMCNGWKCIPVDRQRIDLSALRSIIQVLKDGNILLFPEGTRSRTGKLGPAKNGLGLIIREAKPLVVPIFIDGMEKVLPIGTWNPRIGQKIIISVGSPLDMKDFINMKDRRQSIEIITRHVMQKIANLEPKADNQIKNAINQ